MSGLSGYGGSVNGGMMLPVPAGMSKVPASPTSSSLFGGRGVARHGRAVAIIVCIVAAFLLLSFFIAPPPQSTAADGGGVTPTPASATFPVSEAASPSGLPLANYAAVIDAGSSGSRIYVYQYRLPFSEDYTASAGSAAGSGSSTGAGTAAPGGDPTADILHIAIAEDSEHRSIIKKQEPGLSAFGPNPGNAFSSIKPLLDFAAAHIPSALVASTPVYVLATAGLRLLPVAERDAVLANVRAGLRTEAQAGRFLFESDSQVNVISGEEEGLYGWVALNYLRNRFGDLENPYSTGGLDPHSFTVLPTPPVNPYYLDAAADAGAGATAGVGAGAGASAGADAGAGTGGSAGKKADATPNTVGLVEIGGGSAQIAFEAPDVVDIDVDGDGIVDPGSAVPHPADFVFNLDLDLVSCDRGAAAGPPAPVVEGMTGAEALRRKQIGRLGKGGHKYSVYTASFLGFGANSARDRYVIASAAAARNAGKAYGVIEDPCLLAGQQQQFDAAAPRGWGVSLTSSSGETSSSADLAAAEADTAHWTFVGTGNWTQCREMLTPLLDKDIPCPFPCPFGGRYQPALTPEVLARNFYAFSEYWYSTRDVLELDPMAFSGRALETASLALCDRDRNTFASAQKRLSEGGYPAHASADRLRQQCFKAAWMDVVLFQGHGFPREREHAVQPVSAIENTEVQWSLGALLVLVTDKVKREGGYCRALQRNDAIADAHLKAALERARAGLIGGGNGSGAGAGAGAGGTGSQHKPGQGYAPTPAAQPAADWGNSDAGARGTGRHAYRASVLAVLIFGAAFCILAALARLALHMWRRHRADGGSILGGSGNAAPKDVRWQSLPMIVGDGEDEV